MQMYLSRGRETRNLFGVAYNVIKIESSYHKCIVIEIIVNLNVVKFLQKFEHYFDKSLS